MGYACIGEREGGREGIKREWERERERETQREIVSLLMWVLGTKLESSVWGYP